MRNRAGLETRSKILEATRALLSERGLDGTTVKAICDRAGVRAGSFYNLFDSKEQVIFSVLGEAIAAVDPDPSGSGEEHVGDLVDAYIRFVMGEPELARVYLVLAVNGSLTDAGIAHRIAGHHRARIERFTAAITKSRPGLDPEQARARAEALLAALNGYTMQWLLDPAFDLADHAHRLLTMEPATTKETTP
jgi:AcrR family transcriptional regulator